MHVVAVDLVEGAVAPAVERPPPVDPVGRVGVGERRVGDRREVAALRRCRADSRGRDCEERQRAHPRNPRQSGRPPRRRAHPRPRFFRGRLHQAAPMTAGSPTVSLRHHTRLPRWPSAACRCADPRMGLRSGVPTSRAEREMALSERWARSTRRGLRQQIVNGDRCRAARRRTRNAACTATAADRQRRSLPQAGRAARSSRRRGA